MIEVWVDDHQAGTFIEEIRPNFQKSSMTFTYLDSWIADPQSFAISPDLPLQRGPHTPAVHRTTFRSFDDAAPDSWGRRLMEARFRQEARQGIRRPHSASEIDMLLAVDDNTRQGALRFRRDGTFISEEGPRAGIHELKKLVAAAGRFTEDGSVDDDVRELIGVGSSPGGAQPKAWIHAPDGTMMLAKFPQTSDLYDVSAWELTAVRLQEDAGIRVMPSKRIALGPSQSVFLTQRFDREGGRRIPYMSFRTAFDTREDHPDYATLAREVAAISAEPDKDAAELFSRAAMLAMINNIDDHMRNHGLLHTGKGWRLSPSFDVNPSRHGSSDTPLTPEDDPYDRDVRLLVEHADEFRLTRNQAVDRLRTVEAAISGWRETAIVSGVDPESLGHMSRAFENENRERVVSLREAPVLICDLGPSPGKQNSTGDIWVPPHTRRGQPVEGHFRRRRRR